MSTPWKKKPLQSCRLYAILDKEVCAGKSLPALARRIRNSGVDIIQYRDKVSAKRDVIREAEAISKELSAAPVLFLINDYLDVARVVKCEGIHLGQNDTSIKTTRRILGPNKIIGISCHSLKQALNAQENGADYLSIGPIFKTPTKPQYEAVGLSLVAKVSQRVHLPFFAIGGINKENASCVMAYGAKRFVVCRAVCQSRKPAASIKNLLSLYPHDAIRTSQK